MFAKKFRAPFGRAAAVGLGVAFTLVVAACGGGTRGPDIRDSGDYGEAPSLQISPANGGTIFSDEELSAVATYATIDGVAVVCADVPQGTLQTSVTSGPTTTTTVKPAKGVWPAGNCAAYATLSGQTYTVNFTVTCRGDLVADAAGVCAKPAASWPPAMAAIGTVVVGAGQLPSGCTSGTQACWQAALMDGSVKVLSTGLAYEGRQLAFAFYKHNMAIHSLPAVDRWVILPIYADDGKPWGSDIGNGGNIEIDRAFGTPTGAIGHFKGAAPGECFEAYYDGRSTIGTRPMACPDAITATL